MTDHHMYGEIRDRAEAAVEPLRRHAGHPGKSEFHTVANAIVTAIMNLAEDVLGKTDGNGEANGDVHSDG